MKVYNICKVLIPVLVLFSGCGDKEKKTTTHKSTVKLDGKLLLQQKCSSCHNIDFPPKDFKNEVAPPMMTISFHFNDWFKANSDSEKLLKQQDFVEDFVLNPTREKSYCKKEMLDKYGLMPSQKGKVTKDELRAIAKYVFTQYTPTKLSKKEEALEKLHSLPKGEQLTIQYKCISCHSKTKQKVGPSFSSIGKKYYKDKTHITNSIKNGSRNIWKESKGATMPQFKNIDQKDLNTIASWIMLNK